MIDESIKTKSLCSTITKSATISKNIGSIFSILTESVYSDVMGAGIREIISNGIDSTTRARNNQPIEIELPTRFAPKFSVRDYGLGLSHEEIYDLYTSVGESSKKDVENEIGFFGIGAMSPFAYVDAFTVVSYQNGKSRTYSIFMAESGVPEIAFIKETASDQPNGLEVSYSVKATDINNFCLKVQSCLRYIPKDKWIWKNNSGPNVTFYEDEIRKSPNFVLEIEGKYFINNRTYSYYNNTPQLGNIVVMGGVAYEYDSNVTGSRLFQAHSLVINAPLGAVSIQASREKLKMNTKTISFLKTCVMEVDDKIKETIENKIKTIDNLKDAVLYSEKITYGRHVIPKWHGFNTTEATLHTELIKYFTLEGKNRSKFYENRYINIRSAKYALNDIGHGGKSRIINNQDYDNSNVILMTPKEGFNLQEFTNIYGNIFDLKTSDLPKPEKAAATKKRKDKVYTFKTHAGYTFAQMVNESEEDYEDYKDYYIITKNKSVVIDDKLINLRAIYDVKDLVGNKIIILDHEAEVPENAKCFIEYLKNNLVGEIKKYYNFCFSQKFTYTSYYFSIYSFLYKNRPDLKRSIDGLDIKTKIPNPTGYLTIANELGLEINKIDEEKMLGKINSIVENNYPLLSLVGSMPKAGPQENALKKYVSEGDQNVFLLHFN
jgi:hypothetical protein